MRELKKRLVELLRAEGADLVACGGVEGFADAAGVRSIFPEARTVVGVAFRQLRGSRRGVEEGSTYYQYSTTAVETIEETLLPKALLRASALLEDAGFEALPQRRNPTVMRAQDDTNFEVDHHAVYRGVTSENQLDFEQCAVDCGLGERGLSGSVLTRAFGPFVRYGFILTDAALEADAPPEAGLCDRCGECVAACPGSALSSDGVRDNWRCAAYYAGLNRSKNPFMPPEAFADEPDREELMAGTARIDPSRARALLDQLVFYPPIKHGYRSSICGRACDTACHIHLERKGALSKSFNSPFRKRPEWKLPLDGV